MVQLSNKHARTTGQPYKEQRATERGRQHAKAGLAFGEAPILIRGGSSSHPLRLRPAPVRARARTRCGSGSHPPGLGLTPAMTPARTRCGSGSHPSGLGLAPAGARTRTRYGSGSLPLVHNVASNAYSQPYSVYVFRTPRSISPIPAKQDKPVALNVSFESFDAAPNPLQREFWTPFAHQAFFSGVSKPS